MKVVKLAALALSLLAICGVSAVVSAATITVGTPTLLPNTPGRISAASASRDLVASTRPSVPGFAGGPTKYRAQKPERS